jgi:DNA-binding IclR family transcriptional regulator
MESLSNYSDMKTDNRDKDISQTLSRGLQLLDAVADGREGVPVRDLAAVMRLPRSVVQRLLQTLEAEGFLERHPSLVGYRLSIKMWSLGCVAVRRLSVRDVARPFLEDLARKTNEMVKIGVLDGHDVVYLDGIECPQAVRAYVPIGGRLPAHSIATGKAILAFLPGARVAAISGRLGSQVSRQRTPVAGADALSKELERTRKRGYAVNRGDWSEDVGGVAAPLFDSQGDVVGSIGVILPLNRFTTVKMLQLGSLATAAAAAISARLGHRTSGERARIRRVG